MADKQSLSDCRCTLFWPLIQQNTVYRPYIDPYLCITHTGESDRRLSSDTVKLLTILQLPLNANLLLTFSCIGACNVVLQGSIGHSYKLHEWSNSLSGSCFKWRGDNAKTGCYVWNTTLLWRHNCQLHTYRCNNSHVNHNKTANIKVWVNKKAVLYICQNYVWVTPTPAPSLPL